MRQRHLLTSAFVLWLPSLAIAAEPIHGNVVLVLEDGLARDGENRMDIELELPCRKGAWPEKCWGSAVRYNRGHHEGVVKSNEASGDVRKLVVEAEIGPDNWVKGGRASYRIELNRRGETFTGSYAGTFSITDAPGPSPPPRAAAAPREDLPPEIRKLIESTRAGAADPAARGGANVVTTIDVSGKVRGRIGPPWPGEIDGHVPLAPGEHPRLILRKSDLPAMKARAAQTPEGKAIMKRFAAVLDEPGGPWWQRDVRHRPGAVRAVRAGRLPLRRAGPAALGVLPVDGPG